MKLMPKVKFLKLMQLQKLFIWNLDEIRGTKFLILAQENNIIPN